MSYQLSNKTKELLSKKNRIPYEKLIQMEDEEIDAYIEQKTGKKNYFGLKVQKVDGLPIRTIEDVDQRMDEMVSKEDSGWDR